MTLSDGTPTLYDRLRNAIPAQMYDTTGLSVGCGVFHDNTECEYECRGCQNYYEEKDMGATYPHCRLKLRKREGCVGFKPTELYVMAMSIKWPPTHLLEERGDA